MKISINKSLIKQAVKKLMKQYRASDAMPGDGKKQRPMMQAPRPVKPFVEQEDPVGMPDVGDPVDQAPGPMGGPVLSNEMLENNELVKLVKDEVKYLYKEFVKRRRRMGVKKWSSGKQAAPIASPQLFNQIIEQAIEQGGVASPRYERLVDELLKVAQKREYQSKQGDADTWQTRRMGIEGQKGVKNLGKIGGQDTLKSKSKQQGPQDDEQEPDEDQLAKLAGLVPEQEQTEQKVPEVKK